MKINNTSPPVPLPLNNQGKAGPARELSSGTPGTGSTSAKLSSELQQKLSDSSFDVSSLRVNEVRQAIVEGRLQINPERIAEGLINNFKGK
ncbi:flagellar biosynthesis anti-sigma factor FlgM [Halioglobus japonicus]|uniref:Negative regulator of flagellin synthesis n=1 Tax=Halioglobus japonicus TaxID=930805 RepID=A0AAP8SN13_9GAMM|nr:flagellar biosynthesis anti-sigma factor FlgM [Halioglobus japonicus]AQA18077.1 flagellar biosynthesis anti-sigma factor FlgM [Halioglobus japonicus]PLW86069.1 flagellar biosynthesis anti-sigma factor FlgM [Halioglobus japonicus]GHD14644.1 hypothetical protein GCM10007052_18600 [Halioglobus japonicus]